MKTNKKFKEWMRINYPQYYMTDFNGHPFSMQWGVYLEFFDNVDTQIEIGFNEHDVNGGFDFSINHNRWFHNEILYPTRQEAQTEAIKKAFEILENENTEG